MKATTSDVSARSTKTFPTAVAVAALAIMRLVQSHEPAIAQTAGALQGAPSMAALLVSAPPNSGEVGAFAFGYLEFDYNPANGVPGFSSWPPASPKQP